MTRRTTLSAVLFFAALLSCVASGTATAATAGWMVNGSLLSGSKALASTAHVTEIFTMSAAGVVVECDSTTLNTSKAEIIAPNKGAASSVEFKECRVAESSSCRLRSSSLVSLPVVAEATLEGALAAKVTVTPKTKAVFATFAFEGETCVLVGVQPVTGKATIKLADGQMEETEQEATVHTGAGEIKLGSSEAVVKGGYNRKLASSLPWSFL